MSIFPAGHPAIKTQELARARREAEREVVRLAADVVELLELYPALRGLMQVAQLRAAIKHVEGLRK